MKIQNIAVIFAIIIIPITITLSAYIGIQVDTASLQQSYKTKLMDATHDAVVAFELNTQNNTYSENSDSIRRDITASVNTFFTSLASGLGIPGANAERIMPYIPALVITLYDGYYIYSPSEVNYNSYNSDTHQEENKTGYSHILKPYIYYSAKYIDPDNDANYVVVNYSLDSYISVYGKINGKVIARSGYLYSNQFDNVLSSENLSENIKYEIKYINAQGIETTDLSATTNCKFVYYNAQKVYNINGQWCTLNDFERVPVEQSVVAEIQNNSGNDISAIKYKQDSIEFLNWLKDTNNDGIENGANDISSIVIPKNARYVKYDDTIGTYVESAYDEFSGDATQILLTDPEDAKSAFNQHKRKVMQISIQDNLNNAIALYNKNSVALGTNAYFVMPKMTEQDWDKILTNVNIISFMQGLPVGIKKFNDYTIVTSTNNKQYVNPDTLYFVTDDPRDGYHTIFCDELVKPEDGLLKNGVIGYKEIDFKKIRYTLTNINTGETETKYYYARPEYGCYKCVISYLSGITDVTKLSDAKKKIYYTALARERYNLDKVTKIFM